MLCHVIANLQSDGGNPYQSSPFYGPYQWWWPYNFYIVDVWRFMKDEGLIGVICKMPNGEGFFGYIQDPT